MSMTLKWHGAEAKRMAHRGAAQGLFKASEELLTLSRRQVPHQEGMLEDTSGTDVNESTLEASVYYTQKYAVRQHEEMNYHHDAGRKAKYLEGPLNSNRDRLLGIIGRETKREMR